MVKRRSHYVVIQNENGEPDSFPLKMWLRQNPQFAPGLDASVNTSHELRSALRKQGWSQEELDDRVYLIQPDEDGKIAYSDSLISDAEIEDEAEGLEEVEEIKFGLERDLQSALRANIEQLESGLQIVDDNREQSTEAGRIDITTQDAQGNIVIIELKAGTATPEAVTQILAYMGAISESTQKPVRGILIAGDFHKRVIYAARAVPNLRLKKYAFQFSFKDIE
jgi:hypothetical protein